MRCGIALMVAVSAAAIVVQGAVVQGVVLDDETGNPLARTQVTLAPLPGEDIPLVSVRVTEHGGFVFLNVHPGWYVVRATRRGFLPAESGQMRAARLGAPFELASADASQFIQMRMYRLSAISGSVLDENGIGLPDMTAHVFTARRPIRHVAQGTTDDRGRFRVDGLNPGTYVAHSGTAVLEDNTPLLPTWYKGGTTLAEAEPVTLRAAESFGDATIRPTKGSLLCITGELIKALTIPPMPVRLTLITDAGRRVIATRPGPFTADNIPPGAVELVAEGDDCGGYELLSVQKDMNVRIACGPLRLLRVDWIAPGSPGTLRSGYPLIARRVELDGTGAERPIIPNQPIQPGTWEIRAVTGPEHYVTSIRTDFSATASLRNDDWFELRLGYSTYLRVTLSSKPAKLNGIVSAAGKPVAGAPVFLEWFNPDLPEPRLRLSFARSDASGNYGFTGLAPGRYRALSSLDFDAEDPSAMDPAAPFNLAEGEIRAQKLEMR